MSLFVKDKKLYRQLVAIAIPVALQNLITFGVSLADTVMVGMLGEVQLSAVANANQLGFIFTLLSFGTGSGASVLIAQYWGKGDVASIRKVTTIMYRIILCASILFTALAVFFPRQIITVFTPDAAVIEEGVKFLRIVGLSYLFMGAASTTVTMLRSVGSVKISLAVYISSLAVNTFLNWVLIFGKLGAPALGVEGAAIATCVARVTEMIIISVYMLAFEKRICYQFKMFFAKKLGLAQVFFKTGLPVVLNELFWGAGMAAIAVIIGNMGREFTAANAICTVLSQLVTIVLFGVANAAAVIVGNTVGSGNYETAKAYAHTIIVISFFLGIVSGAVVLLLKEPLLLFYKISPLAGAYARQIITIYAVVVSFVSMAGTLIIGVLRGGGDTRFALFLDVVFMWFFCIPAGFFAGLRLGWPVWAVYMILKSDELLKVLAALIRVWRGKWINDVTIR